MGIIGAYTCLPLIHKSTLKGQDQGQLRYTSSLNCKTKLQIEEGFNWGVKNLANQMQALKLICSDHWILRRLNLNVYKGFLA